MLPGSLHSTGGGCRCFAGSKGDWPGSWVPQRAAQSCAMTQPWRRTRPGAGVRDLVGHPRRWEGRPWAYGRAARPRLPYLQSPEWPNHGGAALMRAQGERAQEHFKRLLRSWGIWASESLNPPRHAHPPSVNQSAGEPGLGELPAQDRSWDPQQPPPLASSVPILLPLRPSLTHAAPSHPPALSFCPPGRGGGHLPSCIQRVRNDSSLVLVSNWGPPPVATTGHHIGVSD